MLPFANKLWLPSLKAQWLIGAFMAMLPLMLAMVYGFHQMDHQNRAQRELVMISGQVAELGASLTDQGRDLERVSRQYQVLVDERLRQVFEQKRDALLNLLGQMTTVVDDARVSEQASIISVVLALIEGQLFSTGADGDLRVNQGGRLGEGGNDAFRQLHETIKQLNLAASSQVESELDQLEARYVASQWQLLVMALSALPVTLLLVWLVSFMVLRPIYQLSAAIRSMGQGNWRTDIGISGSNEMVALGENLKWMQQQLLMLEAQKQTFLQQITHELKTPLAAIMEAGSLLGDEVPGPVNGQQRQVLDILQTNASHLQGLIQQLLDYNSLVKDRCQQIHCVDLRSFFIEKSLDLQGLAATRQVKLVLQSESCPVTLDSVRTGMVFRNLLSNALQLTPPQSVVMVSWGKAFSEHTQRPLWWLRIADEGPGIRDEDAGRLFEPFFQGDVKRQGSLKGSGIGLAIVKECVDFLGGSVQIENRNRERPEEGAEALVMFPELNRWCGSGG